MDESARSIVGNVCTACNKRFATRHAYHQHRTSAYLIGTACYALNTQNCEVVASRRGNVSTAILRSTQCVRRGDFREHMHHYATTKGSAYIRTSLLTYAHGLHFCTYAAFRCKYIYNMHTPPTYPLRVDRDLVHTLHIVHICHIYTYIAYCAFVLYLCICSIIMHMLHIYVHTRCMFYIHKLHAALLDSEDEEPAEDMPEQPIEVEPPDGAPEQDQPVPAPPQPEVAVAPLRLPDMRTVMQRTGGPDYEDMIRELDDHMGPDKQIDVPSERCGGGVRRIQLKRKATEMSRSLSETFAYLTSTTASTEDAAAVLQSFGNVGLAFCSCLLTCRMIFCICCIHCIYSINLLIMSYKCMYACAYGV